METVHLRGDSGPGQGQPGHLLAAGRETSANLPEPQLLAAEIADDLRAGLEQIEGILADLQEAPGVAGREGEES